jgi:hypothetical protein
LRRYAIGLIVSIVLAAVLIFAPQRAVASVTLNYFRATWHADLETVIIEWQTATELNTVGFIVQRSTSPGSGYVDITDVIPAVGDQLTGWTYDPVADDPLGLTIGVAYWYRLVIINTTPPDDVIPPVAVLAGHESTVTPTPTPTPTPTGTPAHVSVSLAPAVAQLFAMAGQSVTQTLRLTNIGDVTCQIYLFHTSSPYTVVVSPVSVALAADTGIDVSVHVFVPVSPIVYSNTVDVVAMASGADSPSAIARVITVVWRKTYLPIVIHH